MPAEDLHGKVEAIRGMPLFSDLKDKDLAAVARVFQEVSYGPGTTILGEGESNTDFFILVEGKAKVMRGGKTVAAIVPRQFFGELASLGFQRSRTAGVVTVERCRCLVSSKSGMGSLLRTYPPVSRRILEELRDRYREESHTADWWA
jgi:CRP-like cAMP-binding protein